MSTRGVAGRSVRNSSSPLGARRRGWAGFRGDRGALAVAVDAPLSLVPPRAPASPPSDVTAVVGVCTGGSAGCDESGGEAGARLGPDTCADAVAGADEVLGWCRVDMVGVAAAVAEDGAVAVAFAVVVAVVAVAVAVAVVAVVVLAVPCEPELDVLPDTLASGREGSGDHNDMPAKQIAPTTTRTAPLHIAR